MVVADTADTDTRIHKFTQIMKQILKLSDDSPQHIEVYDAIFTRIKKIFFPELHLDRSSRSGTHPPPPPPPPPRVGKRGPDNDDGPHMVNPRVGGKISSTRKRVIPIRRSYRKHHRRNGSRKNKRYTKKNKNYL